MHASTPVDLGGGESVRLVARYNLLSAGSGGPAVMSTGRQAITLPHAATPVALAERGVPLRARRGQRRPLLGAGRPEDVEMLYWFAADPAASVRLDYDAARHEANRGILLASWVTSVGLTMKNRPPRWSTPRTIAGDIVASASPQSLRSWRRRHACGPRYSRGPL